MPEHKIFAINPHHFEFVGPHFVLRAVGEIGPADVQVVATALHNSEPAALLLFDAHRFTGFTPEARKHALEILQSPESRTLVHRTAVFGLSFSIKTALNLVLHGLRLVTGKTTGRTQLFASEAEALQWLHAQHATFTATGSA